MMDSVPNKPKTTLRNVRIDDQLWGDARFVAEAMADNLSSVVRDALRDYCQTHQSILDGKEDAVTYESEPREVSA